jgi:rSAM/selenodomain-associated transferase 1
MNQATNAAANRALIVFARYPHAGQVKTRLASTMGAQRASTFYRRCAEKIFAESGRVCCRRYLFYADEADAERVRQWVGRHFCCLPQSVGDLGLRMADAFDHVFREGPRQAIIIGSDIPDLTAEILAEAFQLLDQCDIVLGPTFDGGYYLLGMRQLYRELFLHIAWSTPAVFDQTLEVVDRLGLKLSYLPRLIDIDTEEDLRRWAASAAIHPFPFLNV